MTFAEFEGPRVVMVVDLPEDPDRLAEAWGFVIERIRQIHILFLTPDALPRIASLEELSQDDLLREIRLRGMVPQVIACEPAQNRVKIEHSLGLHSGSCVSESATTWLGHYLWESIIASSQGPLSNARRPSLGMIRPPSAAHAAAIARAADPPPRIRKVLPFGSIPMCRQAATKPTPSVLVPAHFPSTRFN